MLGLGPVSEPDPGTKPDPFSESGAVPVSNLGPKSGFGSQHVGGYLANLLVGVRRFTSKLSTDVLSLMV